LLKKSSKDCDIWFSGGLGSDKVQGKSRKAPKPLALKHMYRRAAPGQLSFENFYLPFGGKLSGPNRWVQLAEMIPWEEFEAEYEAQFTPNQGAPAKLFRIALGALIIKERLGTSDAETVEQIRENPYLQYFLGLSEYSDQAPFDASMMVHFRERLSLAMIGRVNEAVVKPAQTSPSGALENSDQAQTQAETQGQDDEEPPSPPNQGQLIVDATCAPADIRYPTDLSLLNEAREQTERIIDLLYEQVRGIQDKPRTYRRKALQEYLSVTKRRRVSRKAMRKAIRKQLGFVGRNLAHIDVLITAGASLTVLDKQLYRKLLVSREVFRQQQWMYNQRQNRIDDRIVSIAQPHVRPIVRGKARTPVEFGAKLSASCSDGFVFLDHLSWDNFNESGDLQQQVEQFRERFGHYPESVHADQIYRTQANRQYCCERGIRLSGKPLGRAKSDASVEMRQQAQADARVRNHIEGKFGQGKRRFSLGRVMAKLAPTAETTIAVTFLVMNLESLLRQLMLIFLALGFCYIRLIGCDRFIRQDDSEGCLSTA
jgi:transposase, IS5 family